MARITEMSLQMVMHIALSVELHLHGHMSFPVERIIMYATIGIFAQLVGHLDRLDINNHLMHALQGASVSVIGNAASVYAGNRMDCSRSDRQM